MKTSLLVALRLLQVVSASEIVKGISYAPMPCKQPCWVSQDDFFSQSAKPMWGARGRGDLEVIRQLGATAVRLYGNNPENTHRDFLDEAQELGLMVIPGLSDYDFIQSPENCITSDFNCYNQVKRSYRELLQKGFLNQRGKYHPALREIIVINEPDLKLPGIHEPHHFCRGILSAVDAMLDAEKEMNLTGPGINFTVAFSFAVCTGCPEFSSTPALAQMAILRAAFESPKLVGYVPKNNLTEFYHQRFHNSFNTANPASHLPDMFLKSYSENFPHTPVMIQEYHYPHGEVGKDLIEMKIVEDFPLLNGLSFFEFHKRYDKGGSEMDFGMFQLGDFSVNDFDYFGDSFKAWCLVPSKSKAGVVIPDAVATAYGGKHLDFADLCIPDPRKVKLNAEGYLSIARQGRPEKMQVFVERLISHMGGKVSDTEGLKSFASSFERIHGTAVGEPDHFRPFGVLISELQKQPSWASWQDTKSSCIADRYSHEPAVGSAVGDACRFLKDIQCHEVPEECKSNIWDVADYVFGVYYAQRGGKFPLEHCYFNGSARLDSDPKESKSACVVPTSWRPKRRLKSDNGDLAFEGLPLEAVEEEEAAWLLVPALLAGVAATGAMGGIMAWCRRSNEELIEPMSSPSGEKPITIQVVPVASNPSVSSMVSVSSAPDLTETE